MELFLVARQMLVLFGMMLIGYVIYRLKWLEQDTVSRLSGLVVNIFNPFLTISSVFGKSYASTGNLFWENLLLVGIFYAILFAAGILLVIVIRPKKEDAPAYRLMTLLPNCGFMGIPVVSALLGRQYIIYVAIYMLGYNIIIYTYGIYLIKKSRQEENPTGTKTGFLQKLRPIFFNSGVLASIVALILFFSGFSLPEGVESFCNYMGNPCIPLSMMLIGCSLAAADIRAMLKNVRLYGFLLLKMLLVPIACTLLIRYLPFDPAILILFILMLSMPGGSMVVLVTEKYGGRTECAASGVALSTLASIITIPLVSLFI